jgi:hypothetical protein
MMARAKAAWGKAGTEKAKLRQDPAAKAEHKAEKQAEKQAEKAAAAEAKQ